jgi:hypothetical protein
MQPAMVPVIAGQTCVGFLINTVRGVEAFDREQRPLGIFPSAIEAATAVEESAVCDQSPRMTPPQTKECE